MPGVRAVACRALGTPPSLLRMTDPQKRLEALLVARDADGKRRHGADELRSLGVFIDALEGRGDPAALSSTPPPPAALVAAVLALLQELSSGAQNDRGAQGARLLGAATSTTAPTGARATFADGPLYARFKR